MKTIVTILSPLVFFLSGCNNSEQEGGFGYGTLPLDEAPQTFAGWKDGQIKFIVIPTFDLVADTGIRMGSDSDATTKGRGREWWGRLTQTSEDQWDFRIGRDLARFGEQEFKLSEGEVFILKQGYIVVQLEGSKAGSTNDKGSEARLSQLLKKYQSEQDGPGQPPTRSESE